MQQIKTYSYDKENLIGSGSVGSVYRAHDHLEGRDVALKVLHASLGQDPEVKERFIREARIGSMLRHPNIAEVYECDESDDLPFLSMELLSGADLRDYIRHKRAISQVEKVELIAQVCDGLAAAHHVPVVHRDIKPSNIFIHEILNEDGTVARIAKILDFGIVRIPGSTLTVAGRVLGTPKYMAPEQIAEGRCESRTDLFSLAIVLYEFLAGVHPFQSPRLTQRILEDQPDRLRTHHPLIPPALEELVYKGLEKDPDKRFASAEEFAARLRAFLRELELGRTGRQVPHSVSPLAAEPVVSSAGKTKAFVGLVKQFEREIAAHDVEAAQQIMTRLRSLAENEPTLAAGLQQCEWELAVLLNTAAPIAAAAAAAQGSPSVTQRNSTVGGWTTQVLPAFQSWDDTIGFSREKGTEAGPDPLGTVAESEPEVLSLVCSACGIANRDSANFCRDCGASLMVGSPLPEEMGDAVAHGGTVDAVDKQPAAATKQNPFRVVSDLAVEASNWALRKTEKLAVGFVRLRPAGKLALGVGLLAAISLVFAPKLWDFLRPVPTERFYATAIVIVPRTQLLSSANVASRQIMELAQGVSVNLLDQFSGLSQPFVRAQFVSPKSTSRPGFLRTSDLGQWSSDHPISAWTILNLKRPAENAEEAEVLKFVAELGDFHKRFLGSKEGEQALIERAAFLIRAAKKKKEIGASEEDLRQALEQARQAIEEIGSGAASAAEVARLRTEIDEISSPEQAAPAPSTKEIMAAVQLRELLKNARLAWDAGDLNACEAFARKALAISPNSTGARGFLYQVAKARESLNN